MKRRLIISSLLCIAGALYAAPAFAYTSPGNPSGYVNDFAHVLTAGAVQNLNAQLSSFEASTSNEIAVVTVQNMGGDYIEHYAEELFKEWGIGKKDTDNGVLLLLSIEDHKLRIEVGYGLEGALPDSVAQRIIDNELVPRLKADDYDGAVSAGVQGIIEAVQGEYTAVEGPKDFEDIASVVIALFFIPILIFQWLAAILARSKSWWAGGVVGIVAGIVAGLFLGFVWWGVVALTAGLALFGWILDFFVSGAYTHSKSFGTSTPWWAGGSSGHSSGGSFGGFGGGSSGGGGASGGW